MSNLWLSFFLTTIAGLSTLIGSIFIFIKIRDEFKVIASALAFAGGVMICVSVTDLIPEAMKLLKNTYIDFVVIILVFTFLILGCISSIIIDKYVPSNDNGGLYRVGIISMLAIVLHNIPEGIATFISTNSSISLGLSLTLAIALHNIPEGISISIPIYYATNSRLKAILYTFIASMAEPLGAIVTYLFLLPFINNTVLGLLFSFIAGIMIQISLMELLPTANSYKYFKRVNIYFILGIIFMLLKFLI